MKSNLFFRLTALLLAAALAAEPAAGQLRTQSSGFRNISESCVLSPELLFASQALGLEEVAARFVPILKKGKSAAGMRTQKLSREEGQEAILRGFRTLQEKVGALDVIRKMDRLEFARRLGAVAVKGTYEVFRSCPLLAIDPVMWKAMQLIRQKKLPKKRMPAYDELHRFVKGPGIYYSPDKISDADENHSIYGSGIGLRIGKAGFFHELMELIAMDMGLRYPAFLNLVGDMHPVVRLAEFRFASLLGQEELGDAQGALFTTLSHVDELIREAAQNKGFQNTAKACFTLLWFEVFHRSQSTNFQGKSLHLWRAAERLGAAAIRRGDLAHDHIRNSIIRNRLVSPKDVAQFEALFSLINPTSEPITVISGAAGPSIEDVWMVTRFRKAYFIDEKRVSTRKLKRYLRHWLPFSPKNSFRINKRKTGLAWTYSFQGRVEYYLIGTLRTMGIPKNSISIDQDKKGRPRITFQWPGEKERSEIVFIQHNMLTRDASLNRELKEAAHVYYERSSQDLPGEYPRYLTETSNWVAPGGHLVLNPSNFATKSGNPLTYLDRRFKTVSSKALRLALRALQRLHEYKSYGRRFLVILKEKDKSFRSPRRAAKGAA